MIKFLRTSIFKLATVTYKVVSNPKVQKVITKVAAKALEKFISKQVKKHGFDITGSFKF